jgi:acetyl-CoA synthetase
MSEVTANLDSSLRENRFFSPPVEFAAEAHVKSLAEYEAIYRRSVEQPEAFWGEAAGELDWFARWTEVLETGPEGAMLGSKWFVGGKLNLSHNCVDRHALGARKD